MREKLREKVVAALVAAGYEKAVMEDWNRDGDLALNCEVWCGDDAGMAGDYYCYGGTYDDFGVKLAIVKILDKLGCYAEWHNPAVFMVVEN